MNLIQEIPPIRQDRPRVAHLSFPDGGRSCSLGCVWVSKGTLQGDPPTGPEWEEVLEVVATSTSLSIYLGPHVRLLESVFRVYNRSQVLKCVEQHISIDKGSFLFSFLLFMPFIYFFLTFVDWLAFPVPCWVRVVRVDTFCLVPDLRWKAGSLSQLSLKLTVGFS